MPQLLHAPGDIKTAQLDLLGYTVPDQVFREWTTRCRLSNIYRHIVEVTSSSDTPPVSGVLGLGPNRGSRIHASLNNQSQGDSVLDRIFQQNVSAPNTLTILLGRSDDPAERYSGSITVGEYLQGLENVTSQPREPVTVLQPPDTLGQHWQVLLDEDGIIGPDGQPIQVQTAVQGTQNPKQLTAVFDTGFTFSQVPQCVESMFSLVCIILLSRSKGSVGRDIFRHPGCIATIRGRSRPNMAYTLRR